MPRMTEQEIERQAEVAMDELDRINSGAATLEYLKTQPPLVLHEVCDLLYIEHQGHEKPYLVKAIARDMGWTV